MTVYQDKTQLKKYEPIKTKEELYLHLQYAAIVELSTIPPYLTALYSLKDKTSKAFQIIRSVVIEEMLHLNLVCNLINAIGYKPQLVHPFPDLENSGKTFDNKTIRYPTNIPHHAIGGPYLVLMPASKTLMQNTFMAIEQFVYIQKNKDTRDTSLEHLEKLREELTGTTFGQAKFNEYLKQVPWIGQDYDQNKNDYVTFANNLEMVKQWQNLGFVFNIGSETEPIFIEVERRINRLEDVDASTHNEPSDKSAIISLNKKRYIENVTKALLGAEGFNEWAVTYEQDVEGVEYKSPPIIAQTLLKYIFAGNLLELGCGTGLIGQAVKQQPNDLIIDGCDYAQKMLDVAAAKNIYRSLVCCDINNMPFENSSYDAIIAIGVFASEQESETSGIPSFQALPEIIRLLKPRGYFLFTVSIRIWKTEASKYEAAFARLPVKVMEQVERPYFSLMPTMQCIVLQKN